MEPVQWEYEIAILSRVPSSHALDLLNALGERGWELVGVIKGSEEDTPLAYLKKQKSL